MKFDLNAMIGGTSAAANEVKQIPCDMLIPYHNHRFELYTGERLNDMVESIRKNGVLIPIVVQPAADGKDEILIGHNRWNASKEAGETTVPAIIKNGLSAEEAEIYVVESNLMQRGFNDLKVSEQAAVIADRYKDMFDVDKLNKIRAELSAMESGEETKPDSDTAVYKPYANSEKEPKIVTVGKMYNLSRNSVARLLRINTLTDDLKRSVDIGILSVRAAVELSYISTAAQKAVYAHYKNSYVRNNIWVDAADINEKKAKKLRSLYADFDGNEEEAVEKVTAEESTSETSREETKKEPKPMKIPYSVYGQFFDEDESAENVNDIILKALTMYFKRTDKETA